MYEYVYEYVYVGRRGARARVAGGSLLKGLLVAVLVLVLACTARRAEAQTVQQCVASRNEITQPDAQKRTASDTVFVVQIPGAVDDGLAGNDFFVHGRLEFRGQFYFLGPSGMSGRQLPGTPGRSTPAKLVSVGEYAGVTLYAWEPVEPGIIRMLFVRREAHCGLQQYWHAAEVR